MCHCYFPRLDDRFSLKAFTMSGNPPEYLHQSTLPVSIHRLVVNRYVNALLTHVTKPYTRRTGCHAGVGYSRQNPLCNCAHEACKRVGERWSPQPRPTSVIPHTDKAFCNHTQNRTILSQFISQTPRDITAPRHDTLPIQRGIISNYDRRTFKGPQLRLLYLPGSQQQQI